MPVVVFPQRIYDVETELATFLTLLFSGYWDVHPLGDQRGKAYRFSGNFEKAVERLLPILPCILVKYAGSNFDELDEASLVVERKPNFELFYVFEDARDPAEARKGCTQVMEKVVLEMTGKGFEKDGVELTGAFVPVSEDEIDFMGGPFGLVGYRQLWQTSWVDGE